MRDLARYAFQIALKVPRSIRDPPVLGEFMNREYPALMRSLRPQLSAVMQQTHVSNCERLRAIYECIRDARPDIAVALDNALTRL